MFVFVVRMHGWTCAWNLKARKTAAHWLQAEVRRAIALPDPLSILKILRLVCDEVLSQTSSTVERHGQTPALKLDWLEFSTPSKKVASWRSSSEGWNMQNGNCRGQGKGPWQSVHNDFDIPQNNLRWTVAWIAGYKSANSPGGKWIREQRRKPPKNGLLPDLKRHRCAI